MGVIKPRVAGQGRDAQDAGPHLLGRALEQLAAAEREQTVADEGVVASCIVPADQAKRMAAEVHDVELRFTQHEDGARGDDVVERPFAGDLRRAIDGAAILQLEGGIAAGVVGMPVGVEQVIEAVQALAGDTVGDDIGVGGIDDRRLAGCFVAQQEAVIVRQGREDGNF